ncbi:MAG TPA: hypothetical protein VHD36_11755 [Pirellulales bacterium]|nr:hypothetical protein [Pirellulales bacterium]
MPRQIGQLIIAVLIATLLCKTAYAQLPGRDRAVSQALTDIDGWLGHTPGGEKWREYLRLKDLQAQLSQGDAADAGQVTAVLKRFESGVAGLERPHFVKLRNAIAAWRDSLAAPKAEQLPELVRAAKQQYQPATDALLTADRSRVAKAAAALVKFLGSGPRAKAWQKYLEWDALDSQLRADARPDPAQLSPVLAKLRSDKVGLDMRPFTDLATALGDYDVRLRQHQNPRAREEYEAELDKLSASLDAYVKEPTAEQLKAIGVELEWLVKRHQAAPLVESISYRLSQPNLYVVVAGSFLNDGLGRAIDETAPVRDVILGTRLVGTGRTRGDVSFRLVPNADVAVLEATLEGVNWSRNVGYNGPAIINTTGTTRLLATKWLTLDIDGIHGLPVTAAADASTQITGIGSSKRGFADCIVRRVASKRAGQQKGQAERVAEEHAEERLSRMFEERIGTELARSNTQFKERFRNPLVRRGQLPRVYFSTSTDHLYVTAIQAGGAQLAAQSAAPEIVGKPEISIRLHESLVNNFAGGTLAGETVGQPELEKFAKDFLGEVPERLKPDPGKEEWTITFADEDPVIFKVTEGGVMVTGRGKKYTSGSRSYPAMNFTVSYKLEQAGQGLKATRVGDIEIFPPGFVQGGGKRLSLPQTTLRNLMRRRLEKIFEAEIVKTEPTELKGEWKDAGPLALSTIDTKGPWLSIGMSQVRNKTNVASGNAATPAPATASR